jgi:hypothetical protein
MMMKSAGCLWLAAILTSSCYSDTDSVTEPPPDSRISGTWANTRGEAGGVQNTSLTLNLVDSNGDVTGSGSLAVITVSADLIITGTRTENAVSLIFDAPTQLTQDIRFNGNLSGEVIRAELRGAGFTAGDSVFMRKQ